MNQSLLLYSAPMYNITLGCAIVPVIPVQGHRSGGSRTRKFTVFLSRGGPGMSKAQRTIPPPHKLRKIFEDPIIGNQT
jgi:hypothetical protein